MTYSSNSQIFPKKLYKKISKSLLFRVFFKFILITKKIHCQKLKKCKNAGTKTTEGKKLLLSLMLVRGNNSFIK